MKPFKYEFSKEEEKNRNQWLLATLINFFILPVSGVLCFFFASPKLLSLQLIGEAVVLFLLSILVHKWVYIKPGTLFLTLLLVFDAFFLLGSVISIIEDHKNALVACISIIYTISHLWWFLISLLMRLINKKIQKLEIKHISSQTYPEV